MWEGIVIALITTGGAILVGLMQSMRKENTRDHGYVRDSLGRLETKLDNHIDDHLKGEI
jgi:hypothetical protein